MIRLTEKDIDISIPYYTYSKKKIPILKNTIFESSIEVESIMVLFKNRELFNNIKTNDTKTLVFPDYRKFTNCIPIIVNDIDMYIWFKFTNTEYLTKSEYRKYKIEDIIDR